MFFQTFSSHSKNGTFTEMVQLSSELFKQLCNSPQCITERGNDANDTLNQVSWPEATMVHMANLSLQSTEYTNAVMGSGTTLLT